MPTQNLLAVVCPRDGDLGQYGHLIEEFPELFVEQLGCMRGSVPTQPTKKKKNAVFVWGDIHQAASDRLKKALCSDLVLRLPDFSKPFVLQCDASDLAIASVLNQDIGGELAPIGYASRKLTPLENKYPIYERECLAVIFGCEKFRSFLENKEFVVHTDSEALSYLRNHPRQLGRIGRWILRLAPFKFNIVHIPGKDNFVADCLSRVFQEEPAREEQSSIPFNILGQVPAIFENLREHQINDEE
ncbi:hypothetical protein ANN_04013 [Periplaneta americana]|uniref:Reverse transcriptase RNase H-like domain-containing protein n=1 Tax=Periplaneta americana TaxID=6978 RepID=A0ABQ8T9E0_PERAM|nr:hypothetical protein ANN_04013 [Periplaneta americana]